MAARASNVRSGGYKILPFVRGIRELSASLKASDLTISCGGDTFEVHRAIVCPQSDYFAQAAERLSKETLLNTITLSEESPMIIQRLVSFFYTGCYGQAMMNYNSPFFIHRTSIVPKDGRHKEILLHIKMYGCGEKFGAPALKAIAEKRFKEAVTQQWPMREFPILVNAIYASTSLIYRGLRAIVLSICCEHIDEIITGPLWEQIAATEGVTGLIVELLPLVVKDKEKTKRRQLEDAEDELGPPLNKKVCVRKELSVPKDVPVPKEACASKEVCVPKKAKLVDKMKG
ncbi:MAG: hypothetical protein Q9170_004155 [Blastenia crenularia]